MPWFPEFASAAEMVRRQTRIEGRTDPVRQYLTALNRGDSGALEDVWPGHVVVYDPHAGEVRIRAPRTGRDDGILGCRGPGRRRIAGAPGR